MRWRTDDGGSATLPSFIVATVVFAIGFATVSYYAAGVISRDSADGENLDSVAVAALTALSGSPGTPSDWHEDGRSMTRWGLLASGTRATLDGEKIAEMRDWGNDRQAYADAKSAIGLDDYQMRVRVYPRFSTVDGTVSALSGQRVAYVGANSGGGLTAAGNDEVAQIRATGVTMSSAVPAVNMATGEPIPGDVYPDIDQYMERVLPMALHDMQAMATIDNHWKVVDPDVYGCRTTPGGAIAPTRVMTLSRCTVDGWKYTPTTLVLGEFYPDRVLTPAIDLRTYDPAASTAKLRVVQWVDGYNDPLVGPNAATSDYGILEYYCKVGCGVPAWQPAIQNVYGPVGTPGQFEVREYDVTALLGKHVHLAFSWYAWADQPTDRGGQGWFVSDIELEVSTGSEVETAWDNHMDFARTPYDTLVIGSETRQEHLAVPTFLQTLEQWIRAGGHLLVTGNDNADSTWLETFNLQGSPSPVGSAFFIDVPDHLHGLLNNPYRLRHGSYTPAPQVYDLDDHYFQHIIQIKQQNVQADPIPLLSVPTSDYFQEFEGVSVVTSFRPYELGPVEGRNFFANAFVYQRFHALGVDYGGTVHDGVTLGSASRTVVVDASHVGLGRLEASIVLYVWRG